ncbi:sulfite exporter TauE/SafE family protein [Dehalogenimonas alkenigignens]|nr:sulfite exporter TauE/SafE family protein [Dehalogenimonas alkenigignens]
MFAFFAASFAAAAVASVTAFGTATLLIPVASLILDLRQAIVLVAFFHFFSNAFRLMSLWRHIDRHTALLYGVPAVVFAFIGAWLFGNIETGALSLIFAVFIIAFAVFSLIKPDFRLPDSDRTLVTGGVLSGLSAGLLGLAGAIRSMFLISTKMSKETYVATAAAISVVVDITRISVYTANRELSGENYWLILPLIAIAFGGTYVGTRVLKNISHRTVRFSVLFLLIIIGIQTILAELR